MKTETRDVLKEILVRYNEISLALRKKFEISFTKKALVKLYLSLPYKAQYTLAKIGLKKAAQKKIQDLETQLRH